MNSELKTVYYLHDKGGYLFKNTDSFSEVIKEMHENKDIEFVVLKREIHCGNHCAYSIPYSYYTRTDFEREIQNGTITINE